MLKFFMDIITSESKVSAKICFGFLMILLGVVGHFLNLYAHTNIILITMGSLNLGLTVVDKSDVIH